MHKLSIHSSRCSVNAGGEEEFPCVARTWQSFTGAWLPINVCILPVARVKCKGMRYLGLLSKKLTAFTCPGRIGQCVHKLLLASGMSNLISCHKYPLKKKKDFRNMPVQTQCRPFQHQLSVAVGNQPRGPQCPVPAGHGHPHRSFLQPQCAGIIPLGFLLGGRGRAVGGGSVCVCTAWRGGMFTKGWLQSCLTEEKSVPMSTPAPENRLLVSGRSLGWIFLAGVTTGSPFPWHFDEEALAHHALRLPQLGGCRAVRACGLWK